jgi:putative sigma-54 modulation protein
MNIAVTFRHMNATEAVKGYATEKVSRMQRFLRAPMKSQVTLSCQQDRLHRVEVEIHSGPARFHAHETSEDMYASIDKVMDKLERQILTAKEVVSAKKKGAERASSRLLPDAGDE